MQQGVTERQRGPGEACSAGRAQVLCRRELCRRHLFALRDVRSGQINRHFVKTLSRCPKLMTSAISRCRQCPRIITPFRGDSARRLVRRWGSRQEGGVVRHGDVRHQVRPDDGGLAPPAGASGSEAFALLAWLARPTFDDEQEEVIVLSMVAGRFRRVQMRPRRQ